MLAPTLTIDELTDTVIKFRLSNVSLAYANALRRIIIAEIPTIAIDLVTIKENSTPLNDEFVAHRLGMVPLVSSTVENFLYKEQCSCSENFEVCPNCSVKFVLKVKNNENNVIEVTTADLFQDGSRQEHQKPVRPVRYKLPNNPKIERDILLMKLGPNQELELECLAKKGIAKDHAKFSPVCACSMKRVPIINIKESRMLELNIEDKKSLVGLCPRKVFSYDANHMQVKVERPEECVFCLECDKFQKEKKMDDLLTIEDGDFVFEVETTGALKPDEVIDSAFQQMSNKLEELKTSLRGINSSVYR